MADQPDWQRFQSSTGSPIAAFTLPNPPTISGLYVGPWKSIYMDISDADATVVWNLVFTWSTDAAATRILRQETVRISNQVPWAGWRPVLAPYLRISFSQSVVSVGANLNCTIVPSTLDAPLLARWLAAPLIGISSNIINHNNFVTYNCTYIIAGPATLSVRSNGYSVIYDVESMQSNGTWVNEYRFQNIAKDETRQYSIVLPPRPCRLVVTNAEAFSKITYDIRLDLA